MIIKNGNKLSIGKDFVDAVLGKYVSHGEIRLANGIVYQWESTFPSEQSSNIINAKIKQENGKLAYIIYQSI